jgi:hypothetical protein
LTGRIIKIGNGEDADFWRDAWCGGIPLKEKFSDLFEIVMTKTSLWLK